jgi:hypothetical protein
MTLATFALLLGLATATQAPGEGAGAPPLPAGTEGRPDFSGTWTLDKSLSTDPSQIAFLPPANGGRQGASGGQGAGGFGGFGGGGFGRRRGGGGGGAATGDRRAPTGALALTPDEQARLLALTDEFKSATARLVLSHHDPSFVVNDARDHTQFFHTSGETDENHFGAITVNTTSRWNDTRVVTEYDLSSRLTLVATYTLLPKTKQLVVRVALKNDSNTLRTAPPEVRFVYSLTPTA